MALHQHVVRVVANRDGGYGRRYGSETWDSGFADARLVSAIAEVPGGGSLLNGLGVSVRGRVDAGVITVEVSGAWAGPVDVLVTLDA